VPTRLTSVVFDTFNLATLPPWWAGALGWRVSFEGPDEVAVEPPDGAPGIELTFALVADAKTAKNRIHLDLATGSAAEQDALVDRLLGAGATRVPQASLPWVVLADPEGNEFCVLEPRPAERDTGAVASIVVDVEDPERQARFWSEAAGWPVVGVEPGGSRLRAPSGTGPFLDLIRVPEPKQAKNRLHLDVAPLQDDNQEEAVVRLQAAGARAADVGQGQDVTWVVLADPEGQEFCVLSPR
jgi:predicted enzyme related to lactoylglutathione lyase